jgi:ABC-type arginine transport system permease subunit
VLAQYQAYAGHTLARPVGQRTEARAIAAAFGSCVALGLAIAGAALAGVGWFFDLGQLLNGLILGVPAMILGPVGYFVGRSAIRHIDESQGRHGGRSLATTSWIIGAIAMAIGAIVTLIWFTLVLLAAVGPPPA